MKLNTWLSKAATHDGWMSISEIIDALRLFPRFVMLVVLAFVIHDMTHLLWFFFGLPSEDKSSAGVVSFVTLVTGLHTFLLTKTIDLYNASARDWAAYHAEKKRLQTVLFAAPPSPPPAQAQVTTTTRVEAPAPEATS